MQVSGKKEIDGLGAMLTGTLLCKPCDGEGNQIPAKGFCQNCLEYLCTDCCRYHRRVTLTKHHTILDEANMPKQVLVKNVVTTCTMRCKRHSTELIKFYCKEHDFVGCGDCIIIDHKLCKIDNIQEVCEAFVNGGEYKNMKATVEEVQENCSKTEKTLDEKVSEGQSACGLAVDTIRQFRMEINAFLDRSEKEIIEKCNEENQNFCMSAKEMKDKLISVQDDLNDVKNKLEANESHIADLFVEANTAKSMLATIKERLSEARTPASNATIIVTKSADWTKLLDEQIDIGKISKVKEIKLSEMNLKHHTNINMKTQEDKKTCYITSMVVTPSGDILCTDRCNCCIKCINTSTNHMVSSLRLSSGPWDITGIPNTEQFAITLPDKKCIQILGYNNELKVLGSFSTEGKCRGIACNSHQFIVSFVEPPKLQILTLQGTVVQTFVNELFFWPDHVISEEEEDDALYVSEFLNSSIVKLNMNGTVLATYKDEALRRPCSMSLCDSNLLVCSQETNCIHLISGNCKKIKLLLDKDHCTGTPMAVCFCGPHGTLYVSSFDNDANHIRVFVKA